jgi:hypothetical protein
VTGGQMPTAYKSPAEAADIDRDAGDTEALLRTGALQRAIFNRANFSSIATDAKVSSRSSTSGPSRCWAARPPRW